MKTGVTVSTASSDEEARIQRLEHLVRQLEEMLRSIVARLTTAEQGLSQRWFQ
jgi:hypothetical protein